MDQPTDQPTDQPEEPPEGQIVPIPIYSVTNCMGQTDRRNQLLKEGWEPVNLVLVPRPRAVMAPGVPDNASMIQIWAFRRVIGINHVMMTPPQGAGVNIPPPDEGEGVPPNGAGRVIIPPPVDDDEEG